MATGWTDITGSILRSGEEESDRSPIMQTTRSKTAAPRRRRGPNSPSKLTSRVTGWLPVANDDAGAPGTEVEALLQNGACPDVFFFENMKKCFGQMTQVGKDTFAQFAVPWWYRSDFRPDLQAGQDAKLVVNGVVGRADVWVNGHQVASAS